MLTKHLSLRQVSRFLVPTQKIILSLLAVVLCAIPLWLGLERVHSAPSGPAIPPPSPTPSVTIAAPAQVLIGTQVKFKVTFTNGTALGYGPFLDVVLDAGGANITKPPHTPPCICDGITFVSAQMVGVNGGPIPLTPSSALTAPCGSASNPIPHPFASSGVLPVTVPAGSQLITLALPFGSFQPNQPPIEVEITANISTNADAGYALTIFARGGFRFGTLTPLDDPSPSDPPVFSDEDPLGNQVVNSQAWIEKKTITPAVMIINKKYLGPESENATGPNFIGSYPLSYELTVDVAPGQTITNVVLTDCLPDNMAFHQLVSVTPAATSTTLPPVDIASPSGCLTVKWNSLAGSAAVVFEFFIPEKDAQGNPVLPPDCSPATSKDTLKIEADWLPVDFSCDGPLQHLSPPPLVDLLLDKCIAIQKGVAMFTDTGAPGFTPGDTLQYTLNFQISDYKTFGALEITDLLGDGQKLVGLPNLIVKDQFGTVTGNFVIGSDLIAAAYLGKDCGRATGGTKLTFLVSQKMINLTPPNSRHAAGILTGGFATTPSSSTPATGQIVFQAEILDQFAVTQQPGDQFVDKEDPLSNCVDIAGKLMTNVNPPTLPTSTTVDGRDGSSKAISIIGDTLKKTVYAVYRANTFGVFNPVCGPPGGPGGTSCFNFPNPPQEVRPGDRVTFRLEKTIPSTDAENLTIEDWLPLPTFTVSSAGTFNNSVCGIPAPGNSCLGPLDQMLPVSPTVWAPPGTNSIKFDYPTTIQDPTNTPRKIDLLFTYTVTNLPFADELFLTNEARESETNTFGDSFPQVAIAQVNVRQPKLKIHKGTIATNNGFGEFTHQGPQAPNLSLAQAPPGATFSLAGVSGVVNSTDVAAGLMDSNLSNVDANDIVTFAITIENLGGAPAYDVKIEDIIPTSSGIPSCFTIIPSSIVVKRGTGAIVPSPFYSIQPPNPGSTTTSFTITSTPNLPIPISAFNATSGANIVTVTFRARLLANVMPGCCDNTVKLLHYSSTLNGPDFVSAGLNPPFTDTATVCVKPKLTKSLITTSEAHTLGSNVATGEIARYRLVVQLPEGGLLPNFQVTDVLPAGMKFLSGSARLAFISNGLGISHPSFVPPFGPPWNVFGNQLNLSGLTFNSLQTVPATGGATCGGGPVTFNLGNIKNNDNDVDLEYIVIEFNALVCNVMGNQNGTPLPNTFSVSSNGNLIATSNSLNLLVVEPNMPISKVASPATVAQGGTVTYTVTITNTGTADAFDVQFTDALPSGLTFVPFSVNVSGSCLPFGGISTGAPLVNCARVPANGVVTITYKAVANPPLPCATCLTTLTNKARVTWTSLPGNGTPVGVNNTTGSITPGASGLVDGERNGVTLPLALNDYAATASALLTVTGPLCAQPPQGMIAWWPLDETAGTLVTDIAGTNPGNNGTTMPGAINLAGPNSLLGQVNNGFLFCGQPASRFVTVADQLALNFGPAQSFSIDAWIKTSSTSQFQMIVDKLNWPNPNAGYRFYVDNTNRLKFDIGPGAAFTSANPVVLTPGNWYHVAVTVDRTNPFVTFYVNGTPDQVGGTPTINFNASSPGLNLLIGGTHETQLEPLEGCNYMLDEVEIFSRALTQPEIEGIYGAGCSGKCKCLLATNEKITCNSNGTFSYALTVTNLSSSTVSNLVFSPVTSNVTITPASMTISPLAPGGSTNVTVTIGGTGAVSGAKVCFFAGFLGVGGAAGCRVQHCITLPTCQSSGCAKPPPGMVAWWPLDEPNGATVVNDIAGFNNQGMPKPGGQVGISGPSSVTGEVLGALFFAGPYLEVPPQAELDFGPGDFSIDAWVKPVDCSHGGGGVLSPIVDKFNGSTGFLFYLDQPTVGVANLYLKINGLTFVSSGTIPTLGSATWSHVAVTVTRPLNGTAVGTFYINGSAAGTFTPPAGNVTNTVPMWIGKTRIPGGTCETAIDELEVFNRALLPTEIKSIADAKSAGKCHAAGPGSLTVTKTVKNLWGMPIPSGTNFPITVSCLPSGSNVTLNLAAGGTQTVNNIPVGSNCTVTEGALPPPIAHPACASLGWGPPTYAPGQTVTIPSTSGSQTVTVTNHYLCKTTSACASLPANMVSWWPLNEQEGATVVTDIKGGHNGTPSGPLVGWDALPAKVGGRKLTVGDHVTVPNDASLQFGTGNFSVDAWFGIGEPRFIGGIVDKLDIAAKKGYALYVQDDHVKLVMGNGMALVTFTSAAPVGIVFGTMAWHHVAVTVDRSGGPSTFYIDGKSAGTFTALPISISIATTSALLIGGSRQTFPTNTCVCEYFLDEVEIFNGVLSASDIKAIFDAGSAGKCTAGIHGKKFNDLNQNKVPDAGEQGLSGWTIRVTEQGGNTQSTTTDAQGNYSFSVPAPGTFTLSEVKQDGWFPTTGARTITLAANESADVNFGNIDVRRREFTLASGMNEFCIWGGGGPLNSRTPIDNPNSGVLTGNNSPPLNTGGVRFGAFGLCYGRILWANDKVAFKYTFTATPVAVISYTDNNFVRDPDSDFFRLRLEQTRRNVYGAGLSPIGFQFYFRPQSSVKPFVNTSGGFIFFKDPVPRLNGAQFNFTYDFGGGVQVFRDSRRAFNFGYKYQHLSNGGRALNNPGFDGHVFYFGYSIFKAR